MHRIHASACSFFLVLVSTASHALDGFYAGAAIGANHVTSDYADQVIHARSSDPAPPTDVTLSSDRRTVGRVFAGMRLARHWALELDYTDLGRLRTHAMWHGPDPFFQFERFGTVEVRAATVSVVAAWPVTERMDIFGRAGAAYTWVDYETVGTVFIRSPGGDIGSAPSPKPPRFTGNGTRGVLALGFDHQLTDRWKLRGEYAHYFDVGGDYGLFPVGERGRFDIGSASIGLAYRF